LAGGGRSTGGWKEAAAARLVGAERCISQSAQLRGFDALRAGAIGQKECATKTRGVCEMTVLDQFRLDGKCILVTGGSRGFGRAIALAAAKTLSGNSLLLVARTSIPESA